MFQRLFSMVLEHFVPKVFQHLLSALVERSTTSLGRCWNQVFNHRSTVRTRPLPAAASSRGEASCWQRRFDARRRRASADPQPYHLYLTRAVERSTLQYAQLQRPTFRTAPFSRFWQPPHFSPRNGAAVFGGSPRDDERSDEVGRHGVG